MRINDVDSLALTKADVLNGRDTIPVVVAYDLDGVVSEEFPFSAEDLERVKPVIEEWPGWQSCTEEGMKGFLELLEQRLNTKVSMLSNGRRRSEIILREPFADLDSGASS